MDSSVDGAAGDSSKSSGMSVEEKIHLVYELSTQPPHLATEVLQAWSRKDILQILSAEMGKEKKHTGLTKVKLIETLLKIVVSKKNSGEHVGKKRIGSDDGKRNRKRPRKVDNPTRYVVPTTNKAIYCNNLEGSWLSMDSSVESESNIVETEKNVLLDEGEREAGPVPVSRTNLVSNRNGSEASLPITPLRSDQTKNRQARNGNNNGDHHSASRGSESGLKHCMNVIRQLESLGHIEKEFRQKFLSWFGLRATPEEIRIVKVFIETFSDYPMDLAEQLVDTFSDRVLSKRLEVVRLRFSSLDSA